MIHVKFLGMDRGKPCFQVSSHEPFTVTEQDATAKEIEPEPMHIDLLPNGLHLCIFALRPYDTVRIMQDEREVMVLHGEEVVG